MYFETDTIVDEELIGFLRESIDPSLLRPEEIIRVAFSYDDQEGGLTHVEYENQKTDPLRVDPFNLLDTFFNRRNR